jgi:hypothetical protein
VGDHGDRAGREIDAAGLTGAVLDQRLMAAQIQSDDE